MEITVTQFKAKCLGIIDKVQKEHCHVRISKYGKVAAELRPAAVEEAPPIWGRSRKETEIRGDLLATGETWDAES